MITLKLMRNIAQPNVIYKNAIAIKGYEAVIAELYEDTDILKPSFKLAWDDQILQANYIWCEGLQRYYFIDDYIAETGGGMRLNCHVDVLSTYSNYISRIPMTITRMCYTDSNYASAVLKSPLAMGPTYVPDALFPLKSEKEIKTYQLAHPNGQPVKVFNIDEATPESYNYILTVCGYSG